ncbi:hypothetical protein RF542_05370 [Pseudomonas aeruginosa]
MKKLLISLTLLFSFSSAFALEPEFEERYKDHGIENGKVQGFNFTFSPENRTLHNLYKLNPQLTNDKVVAKGIVDKNDSLDNAYSDEARRVVYNEAGKINKISNSSHYLLIIICLIFFIIACKACTIEKMQQKQFRNSWIFSMCFASIMMYPNLYGGHTTIFQSLIYDVKFASMYVVNSFNSSALSELQNGNVQTVKTDYKEAAERTVSEHYVSAVVNNALSCIQSDKYHNRIFNTDTLYTCDERYVHLNDSSITHYQPVEIYDTKFDGIALHESGLLTLHYTTLDKSVADKIKPTVIEPVNSISELSKWNSYADEMKENKVSAELVKAAAFYFFNNSELNIFKQRYTKDFITQLETAQFIEARACEYEQERKYDSRKALESGKIDRNYCLIKNGNQITVTADSGNVEKADALTEALVNEIYEFRLEINRQFWSALQYKDVNERLFKVLHKGFDEYVMNSTALKNDKISDNHYMYMLNNNISYTYSGRDSFIDDSKLTTRKNSQDVLLFNEAYAEVIGSLSTQPENMSDVDFSAMSTDYIANKSLTDKNASSITTIGGIFSSIKTEVYRSFNYEPNCNLAKCLWTATDPKIGFVNLGRGLINTAAKMKSASVLVQFLATKEVHKTAKANVKNNKGMISKAVQFTKAAKNGVQSMANALVNMFSITDLLIIPLFLVGGFLAYVVPSLEPMMYMFLDNLINISFVVSYLFSWLLLARFFNYNDENNWRYIAISFFSIFGTIFFLPILNALIFLISTEVSGFFTNAANILVLKALMVNSEGSGIFVTLLSIIALFFYLVMSGWSITTLILKTLFGLALSFLERNKLHGDFFNMAEELLHRIDTALAIVCPAMWIYMLVRRPSDSAKNGAESRFKRMAKQMMKKPAQAATK